jgi:hypothetical protein
MIVVVEASLTTVTVATPEGRIARIPAYTATVSLSGDGISKTNTVSAVEIELDGKVVASTRAGETVPYLLLAVTAATVRIVVIPNERLSIHTKA